MGPETAGPRFYDWARVPLHGRRGGAGYPGLLAAGAITAASPTQRSWPTTIVAALGTCALAEPGAGVAGDPSVPSKMRFKEAKGEVQGSPIMTVRALDR